VKQRVEETARYRRNKADLLYKIFGAQRGAIWSSSINEKYGYTRDLFYVKYDIIIIIIIIIITIIIFTVAVP
jgi:hypothetical protein